jgi:hypothetical protein
MNESYWSPRNASVFVVAVPTFVSVNNRVAVAPGGTVPKLNPHPEGYDSWLTAQVAGGSIVSNGVPLLPLRMMLPLVWVLVARSVAVSVSPSLVGAYSTLTEHDLPLAGRLPLQSLVVMVNADEPDSVGGVKSPEARPPEFVSAKVVEALCPAVASSVPKS